VKIRNFVHKGLKRLYLEDSAKGLPPDAVDKLRAMLTFLQDTQDPEKLRTFPLWKAHPLAGDRKGVWSLLSLAIGALPSGSRTTRYWTSIMKTIIEEKTMRMLNPVHPGRFLRTEIIEAYGLSVTEAARVLRVSRPTLSSLLNAKADLSGEMALRFEKAFGVDMDTLMRMQNSYDIACMRSREKTIRVARYQPQPAA